MTEIQQSLRLFDSVKGKLGESVGHKLGGGSVPGDRKPADSEEMGRSAPSASHAPGDTHGVGGNVTTGVEDAQAAKPAACCPLSSQGLAL